MRGLHLRHLLWRALRHELAAARASLRPEIDHPVGPLHDVEVVLHHEHRVARLDEPVEHCEQLPHVGHVQPRRGLVENVERLAGRALGQFARKLHALGLAARERRRRLAEVEVVEAHVVQRLQLARDVGGIGEEFEGVADLHVQKFGDVLPLPADLERVFREPGPVTHVAGHPHVGEKIHVEPRRAVAFAGLAAAARHVEAEPPGLPAALLRLGQHREQRTDVVPDLHVGRRIRPRRAADRRLVDHDHLVELVRSRDRVELARHCGLASEQPPQLGLEHVAHERTLAAARHAGHAHEKPERDLDVDPLQVVVTHAGEFQRLACGLAAFFRHLDRFASGEKRARQAAVTRRHVGWRARRHDFAAPLARAWPEVHHPVGRADRVFIVLHDDHRVALVAECLEGAQELDVVSGMQPDRGLVEDVEHAREPRADLRGQANPLALAAGKRGGFAVEREIAKAHLVEKLEPRADLLEEFRGDQGLRAVENEVGEKFPRVRDRQGTQCVERERRRSRASGLARDPHGPGLRREPRSLAGVAGRHPHQLFEHPPDDAALGVPPLGGQECEDAFKLRLRAALGPAALPRELDLLDARAREPDLALGRGELFPRRFEERAGGELLLRFGVRGHAREQPPHPARHVAEGAEHTHAALFERLRRVGDELLGIDAVDVAEAVAHRAGADGAIETEELRLGRRVAHATGHARIAARKHEVAAAITGTVGTGIDGHDHLAAAGAEREIHRLGQPAAAGGVGHDPVDHDVDRMLELLFERRRILHPHDPTVDPGPREALSHEIGEQIAVLPLLVAHQRREHEHLLVGPLGENFLHDLVARLRLEHGVALGAVGRADPCVEHAQEIVDLRHRGHGRPRVRAGRLLGDRDRGREACDAVDVGPGQLPEELSGERGEALDVAPLPLGIERVEGEARLARAAHARQAHEPAPRQGHRDVAQVVLAGTSNDDRRNVHTPIVESALHCGDRAVRSNSSIRPRKTAAGVRGGSSTGRARRSQCRGWEFDPPPLHF